MLDLLLEDYIEDFYGYKDVKVFIESVSSCSMVVKFYHSENREFKRQVVVEMWDVLAWLNEKRKSEK